MTMSRPSSAGEVQLPAADARDGSDGKRKVAGENSVGERGRPPAEPPGQMRRRRRHRSHRGKAEFSQPGSNAQVDRLTRERMFQDIEGLLRRIREQAEEVNAWSVEELHEITQTVTGFTRSLEQEGDPVSQRSVTEYQRIREKLSQALKGAAQP
jgi:hypothetical protein